MLKVFGYLSKSEGLSTSAFIDYYENHHVPLILSLAPAPTVYKRHYVQRGEPTNVGEEAIDFDVVTEMEFGDHATFMAWLTAVNAAGDGEQVATDEARFIDRARTRASVVCDYVTAG